jgi:threonine dehydrogenase-like Zn-dependent dehydrogenase
LFDFHHENPVVAAYLNPPRGKEFRSPHFLPVRSLLEKRRRIQQALYNRQLMQAILHDRRPIAKIVNATVLPLSDAAQGYADFDKGAARKFVLDPHSLL